MDINAADGTQIPGPLEGNYESDTYWEDMIGFDPPYTTGDQASLEAVRGASSFTSTPSDSRTTPSALQSSNTSCCTAGYPISRSPAKSRATFDDRVAPRANAPGNSFVTPDHLTPLPNDPFGAIDIESSWRGPWPATPRYPERCWGIRCGGSQQPQLHQQQPRPAQMTRKIRQLF